MFYLAAIGLLATISIIAFQIRRASALKADRAFLKLRQLTEGAAFPRVSVIVPVHNEERNIQACLESLLALDYPLFEILVVDDQSTDRTASLIQATISNHEHGPQIRLLQNGAGDDRSGWRSGKSFVLWNGAQHAKGDWLLFVDADTRQKKDTLWRAMTLARQLNLSAISLSGTYVNPGFWGEVLEAAIYIAVFLTMPLRRIHSSSVPVSWLNGQFILIERKTYFTVDGHRAIRKYAFDDLAMARHLKSQKVSFRFLPAASAFECRNYVGLQEALRNWVRLLAGGSPWLGLGRGYFVLSIALFLLVGVMPFLSLFLQAVGLCDSTHSYGISSTQLFFTQAVLVILFQGLNRMVMKMSILPALFAPIGALLCLVVYILGFRTRFIQRKIEFHSRIIDIDDPL